VGVMMRTVRPRSSSEVSLSSSVRGGTLQVFAGNINTYIAELREINPPIIARKIRLIPHSNHPRTICLRLELYGCLWRGRFLPLYDIYPAGHLSPPFRKNYSHRPRT